MASSLPIIRQFSWSSLLPQILVIALLSIFARIIGLNNFLSFDGIEANVMWGAIGQLGIWFLLRYTIARHHTQGMSLVKQEKFADAIPLFKESYATFSSILG